MATGNYENDYCFEDSDQEAGSDSEEDVETQIATVIEDSPVKSENKSVMKPDSSDDEFEQAMSRELDDKITKGFAFHKNAIANSATVKAEAENDALFYDPKMDEDDEAWVKKQRIIIAGQKVGDEKKLPKTDAVLNCPACLCQLCTDCQRHSLYENQYRAMFVTNCLVNYGETLKFKRSSKRNRKRKLNNSMESGNQAIKSDFSNMEVLPPGPLDSLEDESGNDITAEDELYNPVSCSNCKTKVALYDQDEVYHFFNTVTSYG